MTWISSSSFYAGCFILHFNHKIFSIMGRNIKRVHAVDSFSFTLVVLILKNWWKNTYSCMKQPSLDQKLTFFRHRCVVIFVTLEIITALEAYWIVALSTGTNNTWPNLKKHQPSILISPWTLLIFDITKEGESIKPLLTGWEEP